MNSSLSNESFVVKQQIMTAKREDAGIQPGNIAAELRNHKALWDEQAVKAQHLQLLRTLACRWDILKAWEACQCDVETSGRAEGMASHQSEGSALAIATMVTLPHWFQIRKLCFPGLKPKMMKAKKGTFHFLLDPVGMCTSPLLNSCVELSHQLCYVWSMIASGNHRHVVPCCRC